MSEDQDMADVARVLSGDMEAFAGIVRRWQGRLVALAFRFCRDRYKAEEMAQTAFLKTFQALSQWRGDGTFGSWLYALATNVYRSEMRRYRRFALPLDLALDLARQQSDSSDNTDLDQKMLVQHAVMTLPERYRDVIVLFYFHDMDVRETARSLGVAEGTVKARLHRARALLQKKLRRNLPGSR